MIFCGMNTINWGQNDDNINNFNGTLTREFQDKHRLVTSGKDLVQMEKYVEAPDHWQK